VPSSASTASRSEQLPSAGVVSSAVVLTAIEAPAASAHPKSAPTTSSTTIDPFLTGAKRYFKKPS
jgi:hypothetical protein